MSEKSENRRRDIQFTISLAIVTLGIFIGAQLGKLAGRYLD